MRELRIASHSLWTFEGSLPEIRVDLVLIPAWHKISSAS